MKFTAVGDVAIQRRIQKDFEGFEELRSFIMQGDARFFNLETTLNREGECCASAFSGGTYLRANPEVLEDVKSFGFNMTSFNNNHTLDFSYSGLAQTLDAVNKSGLVHSGTGNNLAEASAPRYLDTKNGRVALISVNTTFDLSAKAGEQSPRVPGRPGINGLHVEKYVEVTPESLKFIQQLAKESNINAQKEIERKEGYVPELTETQAELGDIIFCLGKTNRCIMKVNSHDMERVEKAIYEAKQQSDYIIISIHSHQISGDTKENPPEFLQSFAHRCIDCGANAVIGHGPHLLRPIEIYKDSPIFYSLGDFVLQLYDIELAPEDFFAKQGLTSSSTVHDLLKKRSKNFTIGLMTDKRMFQTVIPFWETEGTKLTKLELLPVELIMDGHHSQIGLPKRNSGPEIKTSLEAMCVKFGTAVEWGENGVLVCKPNTLNNENQSNR